jgi:hypothetical protein
LGGVSALCGAVRVDEAKRRVLGFICFGERAL